MSASVRETSSHGAEGKPVASRDWLMTIPAENVGVDDMQRFLTAIRACGAVYQRERGESTGYEHWQVFVQFPSPKRFVTLKNQCKRFGMDQAHLEPRRGTVAQAVEYCSKEKTRVGETRTFGEISQRDEQGRRSDLQHLREMILSGMTVEEVLMADEVGAAARYVGYLRELAAARDLARARSWRDMDVWYIYGKPGVGKSRFALKRFPDSYRVTDYSHPFDGYRGQGTLILDEFDGQIELPLLLNILDGYPLELPCRYANKQALFTTVIMISNEPLGAYYLNHAPDRLEALYRRIVRFIHFISEDKLKDVDLPKAGWQKKYKKQNKELTANGIF